ncbi:MAG: CBS domain-containing protein [Bradyrhizobiaceae bacterium]|nr:CBS domain-containing protein [Bradyrhizobiaceae bacterium]
MKARDIMTTQVISVRPGVSVAQVADILVKRGISAVPVVDEKGAIVGIVSEGDLIRRAETGTARRRSWWLSLLTGEVSSASDFIKANALKVDDIMTRDVVTVSDETPVQEIAEVLEKKHIKRVPVVANGQLVGIISRANLVQALAAAIHRPHLEVAQSDTTIRDQLTERLKKEPWAHLSLMNIVVTDGVVHLWGIVPSSVEKNAIRVAAESTPGVRSVADHLSVRPIETGY